MKDAVKQLRSLTGAGVMDCKRALQEAGGDLKKAVMVLRKKGQAKAAKKSDRQTKSGIIESYVHLGGNIGVMVEVDCETDFVAKNDEFRKFTKNLAMQIAAQDPAYVKREDVPPDVIAKERDIFGAQIKDKPETVKEKIIAGKLEKFFEETCLLEQPYIKDQAIKIKDYQTSIIAKLGENILIRRFVRYRVGEEA